MKFNKQICKNFLIKILDEIESSDETDYVKSFIIIKNEIESSGKTDYIKLFIIINNLLI